MAGYTRQSAPDIINGAEITAPPLIAEFNQLQSAFDGTSGHSHDGTTGNSPKINLQTSVSGYLLPANGGTGGQNNITATSNPTITDDANAGYAPGSIWLNTSTSRFFICRVNTASAAQWSEVVGVTANSITPATTNTVDIGSASLTYKDLHLGSNALVGGTLGVTGLSTLASVDINGGNIDGTTIGSTTTADGNFTNTSASGNSTITGTLGVTGLSSLTQVDIDQGTIDNTVIGGNTASPITGTTITSTSGFTGDITGDVTGNVTVPVDSNGNSIGTSTFNNVTINGTLTGNLQGGITGNVTATTGSSTFNDVEINGTLNMDAGTTGTIQNLSAPVNPNDAARKVDVDTAVANLVDTAPAALDTLNELAAAINDDANFSTTITNSIATKLPLAGGTMTGAIDMGTSKVTNAGDPTNAQDVATKNYSDNQDALKLSLTGGTMSGAIAMGTNTISGLPNPTANDEAANKAYTDSILGSSTAAATSAAAAAVSEANAATSEANASSSATLAQDWAVKTSGTVNGTDFSAKYWATQADVGTIATNISDINTVAGQISPTNNISTLAGVSAAITTVATNINNFQDFADTYFVGSSAPSGSNVGLGDLWFDTANNVMKVYGSGGFQAAGSSVNGTSQRQDYVVGTSSGSYTGSTTVFPATYDPLYLDVFLNGVRLAPSDFTATNGSSVTLGSAAATGDTVAIVGYGTFQLSSHYTKSETDALLDDVEALALAGL
jgi:hypothetical protein